MLGRKTVEHLPQILFGAYADSSQNEVQPVQSLAGWQGVEWVDVDG